MAHIDQDKLDVGQLIEGIAAALKARDFAAVDALMKSLTLADPGTAQIISGWILAGQDKRFGQLA